MTGARTSGGACCSIRRNAKNLTWARKRRNLAETSGCSSENLWLGAAWLSSARVVRCWVKSRNERNPCPVLLTGKAEDSRGTAGVKPEEGGDDVKSSWPLRPGRHTCYNGRYRGLRTRERERIPESRPKFGSRSATRPREAGIASNRGSATPR